jgi:hypothetical protein
MEHRVGLLCPVVGLQVAEKVELAVVLRVVAIAADRDHTVRLIATPGRARDDVSRIAGRGSADEASLARHLPSLSR